MFKIEFNLSLISQNEILYSYTELVFKILSEREKNILKLHRLKIN